MKKLIHCLNKPKALKKTFKKLDHDVSIPDFLGSSNQTVEELSSHLQHLQSQISDMERKLSCWADHEKVNSLDQIMQMEESLRESLNRIQVHKKHFGSQFMLLDCGGEFQSGINLSLTNEQTHPPMQWSHHGCDNANLMLAGVPSLLPERNLECSTQTMFQGYHGYLGTENGATCVKHEHVDSVSDLGHNPCFQLQLGAQYPFHSYGLNFLGEKYKPDGEVNLQENHVDFQPHSFEPPRPRFDAGLQSWVASSGSCGVPLFDDHPYTQPKST